MCYAIPGKVKKIENKIVYVDYFGEQRRAHNELDEISVGDYIYAQGGYVIERIPKDQALSLLNVWKETFFQLQKVDLQLSRLNLESSGIPARLGRILDCVCKGESLIKEDVFYLGSLEEDKSIELVMKTANFLRQKYLKNSCCVHGIIEISNQCKRNCYYCGISTHNQSLPRYKMNKQEIYAAAVAAVKEYGFKALVLQSGEEAYRLEELTDIVRTIRQELGVLLFISFGEVGRKGLEQLYNAGARGLLLRFETSNALLYEKIHPGYKLETRIDQLRYANQIGYLIFTGGLLGLPGQTKEDIINDLYLTKELNAEMFSFGPFIPHPKTPFAKYSSVTTQEMLKVLSLARLIDYKNAKILVTTAFETLDSDAVRKGLLAGANSIMLNVTPVKYRKKYSIYPNRAHTLELIHEQIEKAILMLRDLGRAPTDLGVRGN